MNLNEAGALAVDLATPLGPEEVGIDSVLGRILAADVSTGRPIPDRNRSQWDGFAVASMETENAAPERPTSLEIFKSDVTAGGPQPAASGRGRCFRIMTGAVLPEDTDTVIRFEDAVESEGRLILTRPLKSGSGIVSPGSDAEAGEVLLKQGDVLTPTRIALAAATGKKDLPVFRRPRVAILSTGDELRDVGIDSEGPNIFCNNIHLLSNLVRAGGGEAVQLGIVPDDPEEILSRLRAVRAELVITTGGMGRGSRDFILEVWSRLGVTAHFHELNISPGRGSALGSGRGSIFLGLPGNPWAGRVVFEEIAAPIICRFQGIGITEKFSFMARAARAMEKKKKGFYQAFEGILKNSNGCCEFTPNKTAHAQKLHSFRNGLAYALLEPDRMHVSEGEKVSVRIPDLPLLARAILE